MNNELKALAVAGGSAIALTKGAERVTKTRNEDNPPMTRELIVSMIVAGLVVVIGHKVRDHYGADRNASLADMFKKSK